MILKFIDIFLKLKDIYYKEAVWGENVSLKRFPNGHVFWKTAKKSWNWIACSCLSGHHVKDLEWTLSISNSPREQGICSR